MTDEPAAAAPPPPGPKKAVHARVAKARAAPVKGRAVQKPPVPAEADGGAALPTEDEGEDPLRLDPPKIMKCRCGGDIPVHTKRRPLEVECSSCGARATLKKKK